MPGGVYRVSLPRTDLKVTLDGVELKPALALGSWLAFRPMGSEVHVMGDLVLTQDEINPVLKRLEAGGIEITALHNHLINEQPRVMYMHVQGHGDAVLLAKALREALALSGTPAPGPGTLPAAVSDLDTAQLDEVLGQRGKSNGGVYQFSVPRAERIRHHGDLVPNSMGLGSAMNFQATKPGEAAITGDLVLIAAEVNPVVRALRQNGIMVAALHSHMLDEEPRLFFLHFWATGNAVRLARGLQQALALTNSEKGK